MAKKQRLTKQEKWENANREFVDSVVGLSIQDLNGKLSTLSKNMEEVREGYEAAMQPGKPLKEAVAEVAQLKGPFNDAKKLLRSKTKYVYSLLKEKGGQ